MITSEDKKKLDTLIEQLLPKEWFEGAASLTVDDEELLVVGTLHADSPGGGDVSAFREETREARMRIADAVQPATGRSLAWGVRTGDTTTVFTSLAVPVMTRLRISERETLDTLVAAGVARSRSDALAWCARFVAQEQGAWLEELRGSLDTVSAVRAKGPSIS